MFVSFLLFTPFIIRIKSATSKTQHQILSNYFWANQPETCNETKTDFNFLVDDLLWNNIANTTGLFILSAAIIKP